jgi:HK97 family phage prohead protease
MFPTILPPGIEIRWAARARACRLQSPADVRLAGGKRTLTGYAAVFYDAEDPDSEYQLYPGLRERIMPGCFDRCLREKQDCRALFNHNPDNPLGRVSSKTLRLDVDKVGLHYEIALPDTGLGRDLPVLIGRGDIDGSSFSFNMRTQRWIIGDGTAEKPDIRELHDVDVFDVGPVTFPAYTGTTAELVEMGDRTYQRWQEERSRRLGDRRPTSARASPAIAAADRRRQIAAAEESLGDRERLRDLRRAEAELTSPAPFGFALDPTTRALVEQARREREVIY